MAGRVRMFEGLKARLREAEGVAPHLYLDMNGYVTVGVGHLLAAELSATVLRFVTPDLATPATMAEIRDEYRFVKRLEPAKDPAYYARRTALRLPAEEVELLLDCDVTAVAEALKAKLPGFAEFPEYAQEALLDMAFNLGSEGLLRKFPRLMLAVEARNWAWCAAECHRAGIGEARNAATADLFRRAA